MLCCIILTFILDNQTNSRAGLASLLVLCRKNDKLPLFVSRWMAREGLDQVATRKN